MAWSGTTTELVLVTERERREPVMTLIDQLRRLGISVHVIPRTTYQYTGRVPHPQVVLLDVGARDVQGTMNASSASLPMWEYVPVILLAGRNDLPQLRFSPALHDFIILPTTPDEIDARIRFALWRTQGARKASSDLLQHDSLTLNLSTHEVTVDRRRIELTFKEFELLKFFVTHRRRVFSRTELLEQVWEHDYFGGTRTVDVHIRRLRAKLGTRIGNLIQTVRNVGYKFG